MSDLVRFGVAMDRALLAEFDQRIAERGYENRSEALRDLVRADLTRAAWEGGALVAATLTLVYDAHGRDLVAHLAAIQGEQPGIVVSSLRVQLDPVAKSALVRSGAPSEPSTGGLGRCLEVMILYGTASELALLAGRLGGTKGVLSCELTLHRSSMVVATRLRPRPSGGRPLTDERFIGALLLTAQHAGAALTANGTSLHGMSPERSARRPLDGARTIWPEQPWPRSTT